MKRKLAVSIILAATLLSVGTAIRGRATTNPFIQGWNYPNNCLNSTVAWYTTGAYAVVTPAVTGQVLITVNVNYLMGGASALLFSLYQTTGSNYGTCNTTVNGSTDTQVGIQPFLNHPNTGSLYGSATLQYVATGLSIGTTYHFFLGYEPGTGSVTSGMYQATFTAIET